MLNEQQLNDIKRIQDICEKEESIQLKLNWEMLKARKENEKMDFFHYENDTLIGFLAIYRFGNEYEICGMVHPSYRLCGVFIDLFNDAITAIPDNAKRILINAPAKSQSAKNWLQTKTCEYTFSEYQMKWEYKKLESKDNFVQLREATSEDMEIKIKLDVACFCFDEAGAREFNENNGKNDQKVSYIIEANHEPVGKVGVSHDEKESYIYGFAVFPKFQGQGYGRRALTQIVRDEQKTGKDILLEVAVENKHALKLYEDCGFHAYEVQDYYSLTRLSD
ncbi:GNAT family N-acetyltransferase [Virgibacillus necropolis]|uniref:GNAT family N-acetyltransferase n=1 Tax=Virgibacillus necropolis TaxID=163877 RepID=A0A221M7E6_9BACI|nr:N-acetyltransferase [Virgibacillus necropolis]ASN03561.1 GNAT family N-acetyltransferase [Virgibacillus necropolis]